MTYRPVQIMGLILAGWCARSALQEALAGHPWHTLISSASTAYSLYVGTRPLPSPPEPQ